MSKVTTMPETGKVVTGFSHFMIADYAAPQGVVAYSNARVASGGVDVQLSPEASSDNKFWTDNQVAETASGKFTGGTVTYNVKGLFIDAERQMFGLPAADTDGWTAYGDSAEAPYLANGFIVRYMCGGLTIYTPIILTKTKFNPLQLSAATQQDEIDWQSQQLTANLYRDDSTAHNWRLIGDDWTTEAEAITQLESKLGITHTP